MTGIKEAITSGGERGIQSFDVSLHDLYKSGRIELEEALTAADSRATWKRKSTSVELTRSFVDLFLHTSFDL